MIKKSDNPSKEKHDQHFSEKSPLDSLVTRSSQVIFEAEGLFPFEIFPDKITICPNRITITRRGIMTKYECPMLMESVTGARIFQNMFFATLYIETFGLKETPEPLKYLRINEARLARRYILALIECKKANIDLSTHSITELRKKLLEIGRVRDGSLLDNLQS